MQSITPTSPFRVWGSIPMWIYPVYAGSIEGVEKTMETYANALNAVDTAIGAVSALGQSKKTNAMLGKLMLVKAELSSVMARAEVMQEIPGKRTKKEVKEE